MSADARPPRVASAARPSAARPSASARDAPYASSLSITAAPTRVGAIIPAKNEAARIAATIHAVAALPQVDLVVVVDDGSTDDTAAVAQAAGARVVRHDRNMGKAAAMTTGANRVAAQDDPDSPRALLFVDADLGASAANLAPLLDPVLTGAADLAVANMPQRASSRGGGRVVRLAQRAITAADGRHVEQPLNGMRCLTRAAFTTATPLAAGWGVEVGMLLDVLRAGLRVIEVPVDFTHRATGRTGAESCIAANSFGTWPGLSPVNDWAPR